MSATWRLFVAVPIGEDLRSALADAVEDWRSRAELTGLRWTDPAGWHLTLAFLGATEPADVDRLASALGDAAVAHPRMALAAGGLGGFPSARSARVAWYGVEDPDRRLRGLASDVREAVGLEDDRRFRPHLTLARARSEPVDLRGWIAAAEAPAGRIEVDSIELMRSHLGRGPARYESVASLRLGAPAHV